MNRLPLERLSVFLLALLLVGPFSALADEDQSINPPDAIMNKPSPVLSPEDALKSFTIEEGFEVQLVASEPMIEDPVCMAWDEAGRLWVCEMRGYMPDASANGEEEPTGNIVILEDLNGDGVFDEDNDKRTVFLDKIVLPRAIAFAKNGLIYADYQRLYYVKINSDGSAGFKQTIDASYSNDGKAKSNVEHQANGLLYGLDNWYYNAKSARRYKQIGARFRTDKATDRNPAGGTEFRGQWGITQDDNGRLLTNRNPVLINYELFFPSSTKRNPNFKFEGPTVRVSNKVYPSHPTPGVNRAYRKGTVDHDTWKLKVATAACGPEIYRGTQFPAEYYNNVFVPEPAGNLLKRIVLETGDDGKPNARHAYEGKEFLTSNDERNRFVNTYTGPDGALYLVDMYRGLIQHKSYITGYLRRQIEARDLARPIGFGRIYRVVHKATEIDHATPKLSKMTGEQLVELLGHPNAWQRHTAQRLLVQMKDAETVEPLNELATTSDNPQARIHALWALQGMGKLTPVTLAKAGDSKNERVRVQVLRLSEDYEGELDARRFVSLMQRYNAGSPGWALDLQMAFSAGTLASIDTPEAYDVLLAVIERRGDDTFFRNAVISGLRGKEAVMLAKVKDGPIKKQLTGALVKAVDNGDLTTGSLLALVDSPDFADQRNDLLKTLAYQAVQQDRLRVVEELVAKLSAETSTLENQQAILQGMAEAAEFRTSPMELDGKPDLFTKWQASAPEGLEELIAKLDEIFDYERTAVSPEVQARIDSGSLHYGSHCSGCHGEDGMGLEGNGPPLSPSNWVNASPKMLAALVLNGVEGDIVVNDKLYTPPLIQPVMAGFKHAEMTDQDIADILTFIRSKEFGNHSGPVDAETVTEMRAAYASRDQTMSPAALWKIHELDTGEVAAKGPEAHVVKSDWLLDQNQLYLVYTLLSVTGLMLILLAGTMLGNRLSKV